MKAASGLGMSDAMGPGRADLSGVSGNRDLFAKDAVHRAFVDMNDMGTEPATVTKPPAKR